MFKHLDKETLLRYLLIAGLVLVGIAIFVLFFERAIPQFNLTLRYLGMLVVPFAIAWLVAVFSRPFNDWMTSRLHFPRSLSVIISMLLILAVISALVVLLVAVLTDMLSNVAHSATNLETYIGDLSQTVDQVIVRLGLDANTLDSFFDKLKTAVAGWASLGVSLLMSAVKATPGAMVLMFVTLVAIFYWCREEERVRDALCNAFPRRMRDKARRTYEDISVVIGGYIRAWAVLVLISTTLCTVGFAVLGAESPLAMGLFAGIMDIIPILGPGTLLVPWSIWSFATGKIGFGIGLLVLYAIVSATRYILEPKVVGDRVGLHPLAALAAIFVGMKLFGILGLILGPIVLAVVMTIYRSSRQNRIIDPLRKKQRPPQPPAQGKFIIKEPERK